MRTAFSIHRKFVVLGFVLLSLTSVSGQTKPDEKTAQVDVVRVNTDLVQTDLMVFDRAGRFVDGLKADQFALKINHQSQPISFFERVTSATSFAGPGEANAPAVSRDKLSKETSFPVSGRTVIFFIDDLHLAPDSLVRTRRALEVFVDRGMGNRDLAAITSSSGQIGFLQQLTNDPVALHSAIARLNYRGTAKQDNEEPAMSEYAAQKIREGDEATISFYVSELMKQNCFKPKSGGDYICTITTQSARHLVIERAQQIQTFSGSNTNDTLRLLEGLMRTAGQLPGRKLVFVISDGFFLSDRETNSRDKIKRITDAAGRAGVVMYTLDARGIVTESLDVTNNRTIDTQGLTMNSSIGELAASQDGLNALARDTGGRAFRNTNAPMAEWVGRVLDETANYYLIAWRPDNDEQKSGNFKHIEVSIIGRPDLTVRVRPGYFKTRPLPILSMKKKTEKDPTKAREDDMRFVIDAPVEQRQIPTELSLRLGQMPGVGTRVTATIEVSRETLKFDLTDGLESADLDVGAIFYNDKGKPITSYVGRLRALPIPANAAQKPTKVVYDFQSWLPAGLYQVRVGVRDLKSGKIGSAMQWIQIPILH